MPDGEYFDPSDSTPQAIKRDVPGAAAGDDAFADLAAHRAADQRVIARDASDIDDALHGTSPRGIVLSNEFEEPVEISQRTRAE
jgi:hypothetical protein